MLKTLILTSCFATVALAGPTTDDTPVPVTFKVTTGRAAEVLLAGDVVMQPGRATSVERQAPRGPGRQAVTLELTALGDGQFLTRVRWADATGAGESVKWEPALVMKRGATASVKLDFPGGQRVVELTLG